MHDYYFPNTIDYAYREVCGVLDSEMCNLYFNFSTTDTEDVLIVQLTILI